MNVPQLAMDVNMNWVVMSRLFTSYITVWSISRSSLSWPQVVNKLFTTWGFLIIRPHLWTTCSQMGSSHSKTPFVNKVVHKWGLSIYERSPSCHGRQLYISNKGTNERSPTCHGRQHETKIDTKCQNVSRISVFANNWKNACFYCVITQ
jgi:hypothetical protein